MYAHRKFVLFKESKKEKKKRKELYFRDFYENCIYEEYVLYKSPEYKYTFKILSMALEFSGLKVCTAAPVSLIAVIGI